MRGRDGGEIPRHIQNIMGKILTPTPESTTEHADTKDLGLRETNLEVMDYMSDLLGSETDDTTYTNEALRLIPIRKALGLEAMDVSEDKKVKRILEWAKNREIKNKNVLLSELKRIDFKLGDNGKSKVDKIYHYIILDDQIRSKVNELVALENGK